MIFEELFEFGDFVSVNDLHGSCFAEIPSPYQFVMFTNGILNASASFLLLEAVIPAGGFHVLQRKICLPSSSPPRKTLILKKNNLAIFEFFLNLCHFVAPFPQQKHEQCQRFFGFC